MISIQGVSKTYRRDAREIPVLKKIDPLLDHARERWEATRRELDRRRVTAG